MNAALFYQLEKEIPLVDPTKFNNLFPMYIASLLEENPL